MDIGSLDDLTLPPLLLLQSTSLLLLILNMSTAADILCVRRVDGGIFRL